MILDINIKVDRVKDVDAKNLQMRQDGVPIRGVQCYKVMPTVGYQCYRLIYNIILVIFVFEFEIGTY